MVKKINYLSHKYSQERIPTTEYPRKLVQHLLSYVKSEKKNMILDIGCGRGDFLREFSDLGFKVQGVDILLDAKKLCKPHKVLICDLDKEKIPLKDECIDIIVTKSCIEHLYYPINLIKEANRVLKKNGYLIVMTPSWVHHKFGPFYLDFTHKTPFTLPSLKDILEIGGFKVLKVKHFYQFPLVWRFPVLLFFLKLFAFIPLPYRPMNPDVLWPNGFNKLIRFSKEAMLLGIAQK